MGNPRYYKPSKPKSAPDGWVWVAWAGTRLVKDELKGLGCQWYDLDSEGNEQKGYWSPPESYATASALFPDITEWTPIKGNTFDIKDELKVQFGARWIMVVDPAKAGEAQEWADTYNGQ